MIDTPRTDAYLLMRGSVDVDEQDADFMRTLERELQAQKDVNHRLRFATNTDEYERST